MDALKGKNAGDILRFALTKSPFLVAGGIVLVGGIAAMPFTAAFSARKTSKIEACRMKGNSPGKAKLMGTLGTYAEGALIVGGIVAYTRFGGYRKFGGKMSPSEWVVGGFPKLP